MRLEKKILLTWFASFVVLRAAMEIPHRDFGWIGYVNIFIQVLMALICYQIFRMSRGGHKPAWLNFTILFGLAPLLVLSSYVGTSILPGGEIARFYTHLYVNSVFLPFMTILSVTYIALDYYFRTAGPGRKYLFSVVFAVLALAPFLGRDAVHPVSIFREPAWQEYRHIKWTSDELTKEGIFPTPKAIAGKITQLGWDGRTPEEIRKKVNVIFPFLEGQNYTMLFWRPVHLSIAGVHGVSVGIIIMLLISIYRSDRPTYAYMDKILLFLGICGILEIFHNLGFAFSDTLAGYYRLSEVGQSFTILFFLVLTGVFSLKLRFLARGAGSYYDRTLAMNPQETTRLIDDIDKLVLTTFFPGRKPGTIAHQRPTETTEG